jgi:uncharacterized membrane protein
MPLIPADQTFALSATVMVFVAFGFWAERQSWGQKLGGPLVLLAVAMAASNLGLIPYSAPVYDFISSFSCLYIRLVAASGFQNDFLGIRPDVCDLSICCRGDAGGRAGWRVAGRCGATRAEIVGTVTSYIGGSLNFVATAEAVGIKDSSVYVAALSADAVGAVFFLVLLMLLPSIEFVRKRLPSKFIRSSDGASVVVEAEVAAVEKPPFNLPQIANGLAISVVLWRGRRLASLMDVAYASSSSSRRSRAGGQFRCRCCAVSSEFELGTLFMYIFFVSIGAGANLGEVLGAAWPILLFIMIMVVVHLCLLLTIGSLLKLDLAEVMIASNACILGPPTAAALAASKGWQPLIAPGILVGVFGYAIATFIGVALGAVQ